MPTVLHVLHTLQAYANVAVYAALSAFVVSMLLSTIMGYWLPAVSRTHVRLFAITCLAGWSFVIVSCLDQSSVDGLTSLHTGCVEIGRVVLVSLGCYFLGAGVRLVSWMGAHGIGRQNMQIDHSYRLRRSGRIDIKV